MKWVDINNQSGPVARVTYSEEGEIRVESRNERMKKELESGITAQVGPDWRTFGTDEGELYLMAVQSRYNNGINWTTKIEEGLVAPPL